MIYKTFLTYRNAVSGYFITLGGRAPQIGSLAKGIASSPRRRWKRKGEGKAATGITSCYIVSCLFKIF